jgi:hypothetical protein
MDGLLWYVMDPDGSVRAVGWDEHLAWYERVGFEGKRVALDEGVGDAERVSTVFLAHDHNYLDDGPPIVFETMIFGGKWDQWQWRYRTRDEAADAHRRIVEALKAGTDPNEVVMPS